MSTELSELECVQNVDVSLEEKQATIQYSSEDKWDEILNLLKEINYPAV